jgi:hypothetical protein
MTDDTAQHVELLRRACDLKSNIVLRLATATVEIRSDYC